MKIVLAHDSFTQLGGAERVIDMLHEMFPSAPVYTLVLDRKLAERYADWDIRTTWLQRCYDWFPKLQYWLFLIPWAVGSIKIENADVVISSSSGFVKNIHLPKNIVHISYCHTPTRFLWIDVDYIKDEVPLWLRPIVRIFLRWLRRWDYAGAQRVNYFIANSKEVQKRIGETYCRSSTVVHPGIDIAFWRPTAAKQNYFLVAGRLQAHKKIDWVVKVFNELNVPLHVVGTGRKEQFLRSIAKPHIKFLGYISDAELRDEYSGALALIYPQVEDFGLEPLEAAACGTPTLARAEGGSLETVVPGVTGELYKFFTDGGAGKLTDYQLREEFKKIILNWNSEKYPADVLRRHAVNFSKEKFKQQLIEFVKSYETYRD